MLDFSSVDSNLVLFGQTIGYTCFSLAIIGFMGWFGWKLTHPGPANVVKDGIFYGFLLFLAVVGFSVHLITSQTIPWVDLDIRQGELIADKTFSITVEQHAFHLPSAKLEIACGDLVLFDVASNDLTYGFGLFRQNNSMIFQMQVVPGHANRLFWRFNEEGLFTIRSTEYSGPEGFRMIVPDAVEVTGCR